MTKWRGTWGNYCSNGPGAEGAKAPAHVTSSIIIDACRYYPIPTFIQLIIHGRAAAALQRLVPAVKAVQLKCEVDASGQQ